MPDVAWIVLIPFAGLLVWGLASAVRHRFMMVEETTLSIFKLMLKHRDLDPRRIPDAALIDICLLKTEEAKGRAAALEAVAKPADGWRRYLVPLLDVEVDRIEKILRHGPADHAAFETTRILLKYGVVEPRYPPALSVEQFLYASERGTLYAELDERISKRELS